MAAWLLAAPARCPDLPLFSSQQPAADTCLSINQALTWPCTCPPPPQGEKADEFFIVEAGQLGAYKDGSGAQPVMRYGPGGYFGELALINNNVRAASVRALTDCSLLVMLRPDFEQLLGPLLPALREAAKQYNLLANSRLGRVGTPPGVVWLLAAPRLVAYTDYLSDEHSTH